MASARFTLSPYSAAAATACCQLGPLMLGAAQDLEQRLLVLRLERQHPAADQLGPKIELS